MLPPSDTRERILGSARHLISGRSYADVGVAEICARAGVKKGSFYHFFPSKRDLGLAMLDSAYADLKRDVLDRAFVANIGPLQRLRRFVELTTRRQAEPFRDSGTLPGCEFGNLAAEQGTQDPVLRDKVAAVFGHLEDLLRATLEEAVERDEIAVTDTQATAAAMLAYLEGVILLAKTRNDPVVLAQLLPAMLDIRAESGSD